MLSTIFLRIVILSTTIFHVTVTVKAFVVSPKSNLLQAIDLKHNNDEILDDAKFKHQHLSKISSIQRGEQHHRHHPLTYGSSTRRWSLLDDAANAMDAMDDTTKQAAIAVAGGGGLVTFVGSVIASQFNKDSNREATYDNEIQSSSSSSYAVSKWTPYTSVKSVPGSSSSTYLSKMSQSSSVRSSNGFTSFVTRLKDLMKGIQSSKGQQQQQVVETDARNRNTFDKNQQPKREIPFFQNKPPTSATVDDYSSNSNNNINSPLIGNAQLRERLEDEKNRVTGTEDRVKQMWMNRERLQVVKDPLPLPPPPPVQPPSSASSSMDYMKGIGSTSAYTKSSYSMTKWSPSQGVPNRNMSRNDDNFYSSNSDHATLSTDTVGSTGRGSMSYGIATPSARKSYAMTRWNPYTTVNAAMGSTGSYLANMASGYRIPPSTPPVKTAPLADPQVSNSASYDFDAPAPISSDRKSEVATISDTDMNTPQAMSDFSTATTSSSWNPNTSVSTQSNSNNIGGEVKKSYSVSKWTPNSQTTTTLPAVTGDTTYLSNIQTDTTSSQNSYGSSQQSFAVPPSTLYDMRASTTLTSTAELPLPIPSVSSPSYSAPAPSPYTSRSSSSQTAVSNMDYLNMLSGVQATKSKKSYSMTKWSPGNRVNNAVSNPYLINMNYSSSIRPAPSPYPSMIPPLPPHQPATQSLQPQPNYAGYGSSNTAEITPLPPTGGGSYDQMYRQYAISTTQDTPANAGITSPTKKSYSMTSWSPKSEVKDVTADYTNESYLSKASAASTPQSVSFLYGSSTSTASAPPAAPFPTSPSSNSMGSIARNDSTKETKSYSMTSWSPKSTTNVATTSGSSTTSSYLSNMSNGPSSASYQNDRATSSLVEPTANPPTSPAPAWIGSIPGGGITGIAETNKKSYAMTSWSPKSLVSSSSLLSHNSESYLSNISNGMISPTSSPKSPNELSTPFWASSVPVVAPSPAWNGSIPNGSNSRSTETKKSYSMTSWSPKAEVNIAATGSSASYLNAMSSSSYDSSSKSVQSTPVPTWGSSPPDSSQKKSYSMTNWSPKSQPTATTSGTSTSYLSNIGSSLSPSSVQSASYGDIVTVSSAQTSQNDTSPITSDKGKTEKSYSATKWSPRSQTKTVTTGSSASYLSNMASGSGISFERSSPESTSYGANFPSSHAEPKKSYAMTSWSPKTPTNAALSGSSASYLSNMSIGPTISPAVAPSWTGSLPIESSFKTSEVKKSYSMTNWSPKAQTNHAIEGHSTSYLENMSNNEVSASLSPSAAAPISPPSSNVEYKPSWEIDTSMASRFSESVPKKSYSMSSWSPKSKMNVATTGSSTSYLANMSNELSSSTSSQPKKSYSMTSWTPGTSMRTGWVDSMGQNGAYWGSAESSTNISDGKMPYNSPGFVTSLGERSSRNHNEMMGSTFIPNGESQHSYSDKSHGASERSASLISELKEDPPMSPQYTRLVLQSDPVSPPFNDSMHAVVGASKTSYGPTKWSPEKKVPRRIL